MNGDTNGAMEDPLHTLLPSSPIGAEATKTISDPDPDIDLKISTQKITSNGGKSPALTENTHKAGTSDISKVESDPAVPPKEITSFQEEDANNSNLSYAGSVTSSLSKPKEFKGHTDRGKLPVDKDKDGLKLMDPDEEDTIKDLDVLGSEHSSLDSEGGGSGGSKLKAVSIHSGSDHDLLSDEDDPNKQNDIIFVGSNMSKKQSDTRSSSQVHEIVSDYEDEDCFVTSEEVQPQANVKTAKATTTLRRSNRTVKKKSLAKGDDDIQLVGVDNSKVKNKNKATLFMNHVTTFIQQASRFKKVPDRKRKDARIREKQRQGIHINPLNVEQLYQTIAARGTTVTPVSKLPAAAPAPATVNESVPTIVTTSVTATTTALSTASLSATATVSTQVTPPPPLLPSLTDDMFVVEAPSFVVPYVYEKPSVKDFRQFVDNLGKQVVEGREKEAQEKLAKGRESTDGPGKSEPTTTSPTTTTATTTATGDKVDGQEKAKKKSRRRRKDEDDCSWDGTDESTADSDNDIVSDEDKSVVIKNVDDFEITKSILANTPKVVATKSDTYFDCSLGKFFMEIGMNQVQEYVQNDLLKLQKRKLSKEKRSGKRSRETEIAISQLTKNIERSRSQNEQFTYTQKKCDSCTFRTESMLVMSNHFETPHMKNGLYKCNFCTAELRTPHDIMVHTDLVHMIKCKLEKAPGNHQCVNCPFEDNGKGKLARHLISCAKRFKPETNLSPPTDWESPAKIPKIAKSRGNMGGAVGNGFKGPHMVNNAFRPLMGQSIGPGSAVDAFRPRPLPNRSNIIVNHYPRLSTSLFAQQNDRIGPASKPANQQPSISIMPLPRASQSPIAAALQNPTAAASPTTPPTKGTFVICEICDGYIKDLEQLRNHMQWIHKVKIHPKMIYNRPPLNCQKCQFRFFTDQGLERHLLGTHGLVTSAMQEAANKGKDAGRCPVCGRVYQWKLLYHVATDHNLTLRPAHLSYKCTVCTATFGMYKQFENHVYSEHRVVAKRAMDKKTPPTAADGDRPPATKATSKTK